MAATQLPATRTATRAHCAQRKDERRRERDQNEHGGANADGAEHLALGLGDASIVQPAVMPPHQSCERGHYGRGQSPIRLHQDPRREKDQGRCRGGQQRLSGHEAGDASEHPGRRSRWGIDEARLPVGSQVLFRQDTFFETYRWYVVGFSAFALAQTLLIGALLLERRTRRKAEAHVTEAEQRYRTLADFNHDWESWMKPDGSYAYVSPSAQRLTGYDAREFYDNPALTTDLVVPEDRLRWAEHTRAAIAGEHPRGLEFRITTATGEVRWIDHVCSPVVENGQFLGVRGSNRDVTERKQSEQELRRALDEIKQLRDQLEVDNSYLSEELRLRGSIDGIVGVSDGLSYVLGKARQVADTSSTVLLLGETGVGKDVVATAIHNLSPRRGRPLIRVNCAALPRR